MRIDTLGNVFANVDLGKNRIKWWQWAYLVWLPTYEVLEGDSVHYFKYFRGSVYYIGESF